MPELPEVETTRRGIEPHIDGRSITAVTIRQPRLRWPIPQQVSKSLPGARVQAVSRRGKYLLITTSSGTLLAHLGMSGSLRILPTGTAAGKHDHVDIEFDGAHILRFTDPRRFGCMLWLEPGVTSHPLLDSLGPEPLGDEFSGEYLFKRSRTRKVPIKSFIMDSQVVVGVGNIYANEALYMSGINPRRMAGRVSAARFDELATAIRQVLGNAITAGGTTLRDFTNSEGNPGYFKQSLNVYGRRGLPCNGCGSALKEIRMGGRSTVYCTACQK